MWRLFRAKRSGCHRVNAVSGTVNGWSEWDLRFCLLCVADHGGDWEAFTERLFDPSAYGQSGSASNGEAFWSHVLDLRRRLDQAALDAAAVAGELVTTTGVAAQARRTVFKRALANNDPSTPMIKPQEYDWRSEPRPAIGMVFPYRRSHPTIA